MQIYGKRKEQYEHRQQTPATSHAAFILWFMQQAE